MDEIITQAFAGLSLAALLFMAAAGLNLIWGVLGIMNFATGSLYMLGAYGAFSVSNAMGSSLGAFAVAIVCVPLAAAVVGGLTEAVLLRRTYARDDESQQFMLTLALSYIVSGLVVIVWGGGIKSVSLAPELAGSWTVAGGTIARYTVFVIAVGVLISLGIVAMLQRTRLGLQTRAARDDRDMAAGLGVDVGRVYTSVFALGAALGALAGVLVAPIASITPGLDSTILISAFVIVVAGGMGRMDGVLYAALAVGLIQSFVTLESPVYAALTPYVVMTVVLVWSARRLVRA
jgi:branched-subunit amino acid ABC-type transport system permease component